LALKAKKLYKNSVDWMQAIRPKSRVFPDSATLHPGYTPSQSTDYFSYRL
jgi:hypothetical protein